jgi:hypothetical protein
VNTHPETSQNTFFSRSNVINLFFHEKQKQMKKNDAKHAVFRPLGVLLPKAGCT